jgi:hypothetical protein
MVVASEVLLVTEQEAQCRIIQKFLYSSYTEQVLEVIQRFYCTRAQALCGISDVCHVTTIFPELILRFYDSKKVHPGKCICVLVGAQGHLSHSS